GNDYFAPLDDIVGSPDVVLLFHSAHSARSEWIEMEVRAATRREVPVVAVKLDNLLPVSPELRGVQHVDLAGSKETREDAELIVRAMERFSRDADMARTRLAERAPVAPAPSDLRVGAAP